MRPAITPNICPQCRKPVIWCHLRKRGGTLIPYPVEMCPEGEGDIGLQYSVLVPAATPEATRLTNLWTKYRGHRERCPQGVLRGRK